jgi:hypothetical protein
MIRVSEHPAPEETPEGQSVGLAKEYWRGKEVAADIAEHATLLAGTLENNIRTELKKHLPEILVARITFNYDNTGFFYDGDISTLTQPQITTIEDVMHSATQTYLNRKSM